MTWWNGRMVAFDLETTSPDPEQARIVTAAVALVGGGQETRTSTWLVDPGCEIPEEASAIHGITTERARAEGDEAGPAVAEILEALSERPEDAPIVIFRAPYDLTVLDRECRRYGLNPLGTHRAYHVIDPFVIDKHLDRYRKGERKLAVMCEHYAYRYAALTGKPVPVLLDDAHEAAADAVAAARLAWLIGTSGEVVRRVWDAKTGMEKNILAKGWEAIRDDLSALHRAQKDWAREQALGLAQHFREHPEKGVDPDSVRTEWPVVPCQASEVAA